GLDAPAHGLIEIGGVDSREVNRFSEGSMVAIASQTEIFHGTLQENISLNRLTVSSSDVREALITAGLWDEVLTLPNGLETSLQSDGYPLEPSQMARLMIARAIVSTPRLLLIDGVLDALPGRMRNEIWDRLRDKKQPWTLIVATHDPTIIEQCDGNKDLSSCEHA
ncbi:MAG: ABC transporter ATP-binding protein, partial [Pirellula sp.]